MKTANSAKTLEIFDQSFLTDFCCCPHLLILHHPASSSSCIILHNPGSSWLNLSQPTPNKLEHVIIVACALPYHPYDLDRYISETHSWSRAMPKQWALFILVVSMPCHFFGATLDVAVTDAPAMPQFTSKRSKGLKTGSGCSYMSTWTESPSISKQQLRGNLSIGLILPKKKLRLLPELSASLAKLGLNATTTLLNLSMPLGTQVRCLVAWRELGFCTCAQTGANAAP